MHSAADVVAPRLGITGDVYHRLKSGAKRNSRAEANTLSGIVSMETRRVSEDVSGSSSLTHRVSIMHAGYAILFMHE